MNCLFGFKHCVVCPPITSEVQPKNFMPTTPSIRDLLSPEEVEALKLMLEMQKLELLRQRRELVKARKSLTDWQDALVLLDKDYNIIASIQRKLR